MKVIIQTGARAVRPWSATQSLNKKLYNHDLLHDHLNCYKKMKNRTEKSFQGKLSGHNSWH
jgi:hypothetical protein